MRVTCRHLRNEVEIVGIHPETQKTVVQQAVRRVIRRRHRGRIALRVDFERRRATDVDDDAPSLLHHRDDIVDQRQRNGQGVAGLEGAAAPRHPDAGDGGLR